jgi:hypothetical protein
MRSGSAHRDDVPFAVDVAIAFALVCAVAFFIIVMDDRLTGVALTRAQLLLLEPETQAAATASAPAIRNAAYSTKKPNRETKENSTWLTVQQR